MQSACGGFHLNLEPLTAPARVTQAGEEVAVTLTLA